MVPTAFGCQRLLQGVAGLRHNHIPLGGLAMLSVVADGLKSRGDLRPLPWMRSYISNFKCVVFISVTFCSQFDCRRMFSYTGGHKWHGMVLLQRSPGWFVAWKWTDWCWGRYWIHPVLRFYIVSIQYAGMVRHAKSHSYSRWVLQIFQDEHLWSWGFHDALQELH